MCFKKNFKGKKHNSGVEMKSTIRFSIRVLFRSFFGRY
jgi:hypothetical protein